MGDTTTADDSLDRYIFCPSCSRQIPLIVFDRHLWYCRQFTKVPLAKCPYNLRHRCTPAELPLHLVNCSSKGLMERMNSSFQVLTELATAVNSSSTESLNRSAVESREIKAVVVPSLSVK